MNPGARTTTAGAWPRARTVVAALGWIAAVGALGGDAATALAFVLLLGAVLLPAWSLVASGLDRAGVDPELVPSAAVAVTLVLATPAYLLRRAVPLHPLAFDLLLTSALWSVRWRWRPEPGLMPRVRALAGGRAATWLLFVLPYLACASRLAFEVVGPTEVRYFGLSFVDFGNLLSVTNLLKLGAPLPLAALADPRPLSYHWLFFALPAWVSDFLGLSASTAGSLFLANLLSASLFFLVVTAATRRLLAAAHLPVERAAHLAGLAILASSTLYAYQTAVRLLGRSWFTTGARNHLLLQLPHSLGTFGNNTMALSLSLLALLSLGSWKAGAPWGALALAAGLTPLVGGYSATLLPPLTLGLVASILTGERRRPLATLVAFGVAGVAGLGLLFAAGLFSHGRAGGLAFSFDGGQFAQNAGLGFLPVTLAVLASLAGASRLTTAPLLWLWAAGMLMPTLLTTTGTATSRIDLSMKTASLVLTAGVPVLATAIARVFNGTRPLALRVGVAALLSIGLLNAGAYFGQFPAYRLGMRTDRVTSLDRHHFEALRHVQRETPPRSILIDAESLPYQDANPSVMVAGRRVLLASAYEQEVAVVSPRAGGWLATFQAWRGGGYSDGAAARALAECADYLLVAASVHDPAWKSVRSFGPVNLYESARRPSEGASAAGCR